ncbi:MAG: glucoamylase [Geobacteraceae bacterium GWC2_58_44]|nr:MAG: glucoamylase [Geobacteraceae bacterium GWC2_58_44]HBG04724.1 glucoamylase [Geobacter sp.]
MKNSLDLALIGNCQVGALIDPDAEIVWYCLPRLDGDPAFCSLLQEHETGSGTGYCAIELMDRVACEQRYLPNSALLVTRMTDKSGAVLEITDFAPRFRQHGRMFTPMMLVRQLRRLNGSPRIILRIRPARNYGSERGESTYGSHHIRYVSPYMVLRLSTDASITGILQELPFIVQDELNLVFGPDETIQENIAELARRFKDETLAYWHEWVRDLGIPFEWQDEVIRAAITLKLNAFDDTGAIVAAMTTSIPESPDSGRNWDYRHCWLRDAYFVVNALNRLGATRTMERYLSYLINVVAGCDGGSLQPVYGIDGKSNLEELELTTLAGYRGMGPVRVGNQAYQQIQHDVYGSAILAVTHVFFDQRLMQLGDAPLFHRLEPLGEKAILVHDQPDAGLWELRGSRRVHTFSGIMCWAACDRLSKIAARLGLGERAAYWSAQAQRIHATVCSRGWNEGKKSFTAAFEGDTLDASMLLMHDVGFLAADDPRFASTVAAIERELRQGDYIFRYVEKDDFGAPENAFIVCTYWYIYALVALGRSDEARRLFENLLARHNRHGLMAEHVDVASGEQWGNFVQTYSMVGLINAAIRLSKRWDAAF